MEIWKDIEKFNSEYQVSNIGRIRSKEAIIIRSNGKLYTRVSKVLKQSLDQGYLKGSVSIDKKMIPYRIHRLVAECFLENPNNYKEVNHINGIKHDNRVENLEWCSRSENMIHAVKTGLLLVTRGSQRTQAKMNEETVLNIHELRKKGFQRKDILKELGITIHMYKGVISNNSWKHVKNN
jgi:hypothetical protein